MPTTTTTTASSSTLALAERVRGDIDAHTVLVLASPLAAYLGVWLFADCLHTAASFLLPDHVDDEEEETPSPPPPRKGLFWSILFPWRPPAAAVRGALISPPRAATSVAFLLPAAVVGSMLAAWHVASTRERDKSALRWALLAGLGLHAAAASAAIVTEDRPVRPLSARGATAMGLSIVSLVACSVGGAALLPKIGAEVVLHNNDISTTVSPQARSWATWGHEAARSSLDFASYVAAPVQFLAHLNGFPVPLEAGIRVARGLVIDDKESTNAAAPVALSTLQEAWLAAPRLAAVAGAGTALITLIVLAKTRSPQR